MVENIHRELLTMERVPHLITFASEALLHFLFSFSSVYIRDRNYHMWISVPWILHTGSHCERWGLGALTLQILFTGRPHL